MKLKKIMEYSKHHNFIMKFFGVQFMLLAVSVMIGGINYSCETNATFGESFHTAMVAYIILALISFFGAVGIFIFDRHE